MSSITSIRTSFKGHREENQDNVSFGTNKVNYVWSLFDGHGGSYVSEFLRTHMHKKLTQTKYPDGIPSHIIREIYDQLQNELRSVAHHDGVRIGGIGSTSLTTVVTDNVMQIINVGDCRAVLCNDRGLARSMTVDHKPGWFSERKRITQMGGEVVMDGGGYEGVWRINGYSVSRSFGDTSVKYITHRPDIISYTMHPKDRFLIMACDGLWDVMSSQDAVNFVLDNISNKKRVANLLAQHAIRDLGSCDNVTIIILFLD